MCNGCMLHPFDVVEVASMIEVVDFLWSYRVGVFKIRTHKVACLMWFYADCNVVLNERRKTQSLV